MINRILIFCIAVLAVSCEPSPVYEAYVPISEKGWYKDSIVSFEVEITDTLSPYKVVWHLRNNNEYRFSNIFLFREVSSDRGREFADTAEFILADPYGKWLGTGVGELKTHTWPYKSGILKFNHSGVYTFSLQQAMREDYLIGLEDVGLGLYKIEADNGKEEK